MFAEPTIRKQGSGYQVSYGDDSGVFAEFFTDAIIDHDQSKIQGRPIYRNVEMIRMMFPGDNTKEVTKMSHEGNPPYKERFPNQYARFLAQQEQVQDGTPIEHWPPISKAQAMELKALKIHTVEALAAVSDVHLTWMGARQLRDNAKSWLSEAADGAETMKLRNEVEDLKSQLEAMRNQNAGFSASKKAAPVVESPEAAPMSEASPIKPIATKMRGRPKKVVDGADIPPVNAAGGE